MTTKSNIFAICMAIGLTSTGLVPSQAAGPDHDRRAYRSSYVGMYFKVPFGPGKKHDATNELARFGFTAGMRQDQISNFHHQTGGRALQSRVLDMQFTSSGFDRFTMAGMNLARNTDNGLVLLSNGEDANQDTGRSMGSKILIGTGLVLGGLLVYGLIDLSNLEDCIADDDSDC